MKFFGKRKADASDSPERLAGTIAAAVSGGESFTLQRSGREDEPPGELRWTIASEWMAFILHACDRYAFEAAGDSGRQQLLDDLTSDVIELSIHMIWGEMGRERFQKMQAWTHDRIADADSEFLACDLLIGDWKLTAPADTCLGVTIRRLTLLTPVAEADHFWFNRSLSLWGTLTITENDIPNRSRALARMQR